VNSTSARSSSGTVAEELASAVQARVAEYLMLLAADANATPEVQAAALAGVYDVQKLVHSGSTPAARLLDHQITLYLADPHQNMPVVKPSGAPPGPPV
jgi:hypothetical protein